MRYIIFILCLCVAGCADKTQKLLREATGHVAAANAPLAIIDTNATEIKRSVLEEDYERIPVLADGILRETNNVRAAHTSALRALGKGADAASKQHDKIVAYQDDWFGPRLKVSLWIAGGVVVAFFALTRFNLISLALGGIGSLGKLFTRKG